MTTQTTPTLKVTLKDGIFRLNGTKTNYRLTKIGEKLLVDNKYNGRDVSFVKDETAAIDTVKRFILAALG